MTAPATAESSSPATAVASQPLLTEAPDGAEFVYDNVKTAKGTQDLGEVPLLVWNNVPKMVEFYGEEGIQDMADGTSFRVSFQGIARRMRAVGKSDEAIKDSQLRFRPGKRAGGVSTPQSRSVKAAKAASEKIDGDVVAALLEKIASGQLSAADIQALTS